MTTPVPTVLPTVLPSVYAGDDDDTYNVYSYISDLKWSSVWDILVLSLAVCVVLVIFVNLKIRKRSSYHLVYCPRYRWEREVSAKSKKNGGNYTPLKRPDRSSGSGFEYIKLVVAMHDATLLRHVGLEMYMLIRFIRLCLKVCVFGILIVLPIALPVYATADSSGSSSDYSRWAFYRFTMGNLNSENEGRLWVPAIVGYLVTAQALAVVGLECLAFVELKQNFFTYSSANSDPVVADQQMRSVLLERLPKNLRDSKNLKSFYDKLFPGKVHSATVCYDTKELVPLFKERESLGLQLERLLLYKENTGIDPLIGATRDERCCSGQCGTPSFCLDGAHEERVQRRGTSAIEWYQERLEKANAKFHTAREQLIETGQAETREAKSNEDYDNIAGVNPSVRPKDTLNIIGRALGLALPAGTLQQTGKSSSTHSHRTAFDIAASLTRFASDEARADSGFVTFKDYTTAAMIRQMQLAPRPLGIMAQPGVPDAENIIWENVSTSLDECVARSYSASFLVYVIAFYWSLFISFCYILASYSTLKKWGIVPSLSKLNSSEQFILRYILSVAPVGLISGGLALLPILLQLLAEHYEKMKYRSLVQLSVLERNFFLQMINLWLTVVAGSIWDALKNIIDNPSSFFKFVGRSLPTVSVYFVQIIIIRALVSMPWEFSRILPWLRLRAAKLAAGGSLTARDQKNSKFLQPEMPYGSLYTSHLMVLVILFLFAAVSPLVYVFSFFYFMIAYFVTVHNALHVYTPKYEAGGLFFFPVISYTLGGLAATQLTLFGFLLFKYAWVPAAFVFILPFITYAFSRHVQRNYAPPCEYAAIHLTLSRDKELLDSGKIQNSIEQFNEYLYRQPELTDDDARPERPDQMDHPPMDEANEDAEYDDLGHQSESILEPTPPSAHSALHTSLVQEAPPPSSSYSTFQESP